LIFYFIFYKPGLSSIGGRRVRQYAHDPFGGDASSASSENITIRTEIRQRIDIQRKTAEPGRPSAAPVTSGGLPTTSSGKGSRRAGGGGGDKAGAGTPVVRVAADGVVDKVPIGRRGVV
jgi:hypothetical protein